MRVHRSLRRCFFEMKTVQLELPEELLQATRMTPEALRLELAIHLFEQGRLSLGKAAELANVPVWQFQQTLAGRGIPMHYDVRAYEEDLETLRKLGRL